MKTFASLAMVVGATLFGLITLLWIVSIIPMWTMPVIVDLGRYVETEKTVYPKGEMIRGHISYCKTRDVRGRMVWDSNKAKLDPLKVGCRRHLINIGKATSGTTHFTGYLTFPQNPFHTARYELITTPFTVK